MTTEKRKHKPIEPPSPPKEAVSRLPQRNLKSIGIVTSKNRSQQNLHERRDHTVFNRLGHQKIGIKRASQKSEQFVVSQTQTQSTSSALISRKTDSSSSLKTNYRTQKEPKKRQELCRAYQRSGRCKFQEKCIFLHQEEKQNDIENLSGRNSNSKKVNDLRNQVRLKQAAEIERAKWQRKPSEPSTAATTKLTKRQVVVHNESSAHTRKGLDKRQCNNTTDYDEAAEVLEIRRQEIQRELKKLESSNETKRKTDEINDEQKMIDPEARPVSSSSSGSSSTASEGEASSSADTTINNQGNRMNEESTTTTTMGLTSDRDVSASSKRPRSAVIVPVTMVNAGKKSLSKVASDKKLLEQRSAEVPRLLKRETSTQKNVTTDAKSITERSQPKPKIIEMQREERNKQKQSDKSIFQRSKVSIRPGQERLQYQNGNERMDNFTRKRTAQERRTEYLRNVDDRTSEAYEEKEAVKAKRLKTVSSSSSLSSNRQKQQQRPSTTTGKTESTVSKSPQSSFANKFERDDTGSAIRKHSQRPMETDQRPKNRNEDKKEPKKEPSINTVTINDSEFVVDAISDEEEMAGQQMHEHGPFEEGDMERKTDINSRRAKLTDSATSHTKRHSAIPSLPNTDQTTCEDVNESATLPSGVRAGSAAKHSPGFEKPRLRSDNEQSKVEQEGSVKEELSTTGSLDVADLEDVSDDETSNVPENLQTVGQKLNAADWASLLEFSAKDAKVGINSKRSIRERFALNNWFKTCPLSTKYLSKDLVAQIEDICNSVQNAGEIVTQKAASCNQFKFLADTGLEHVRLMQQQMDMEHPIEAVRSSSHGAFSARDDLRLRRRLHGFGRLLCEPSRLSERNLPFVAQLYEKSKTLFLQDIGVGGC